MDLKLTNHEKTDLVVNVEHTILNLLVDFFGCVNESLQINKLYAEINGVNNTKDKTFHTCSTESVEQTNNNNVYAIDMALTLKLRF